MKVDSRTTTGAEGDDFWRKKEAEQKDTEEESGKTKLLGPLANRQHGGEKMKKRPATPPLFLPQTKCKSREITGARMKSSSSDVPSCCFSEPHRNTEGGRKNVICTGLWNLIFP